MTIDEPGWHCPDCEDRHRRLPQIPVDIWPSSHDRAPMRYVSILEEYRLTGMVNGHLSPIMGQLTSAEDLPDDD